MNQTQKIPINPILAPDTLLKGGEYRIIRTLGQGGFGITYLAEHVSLGATVCIKEFYVKQLCQRTERDSVEPLSEGMREDMLLFKAKFLNEARKLSQMRHPNIVNVRDLFEENSTVYYVMEYIEGRSLNDIIKRNGRLSEEDARRYISGVASALSYLHDRTMLHLDIKPDNIMVRNEDDSVVVIDFGLAKHYDPKTGKQTTIYLGAGTPGYSPFEQSLNGGGVVQFTAATDIYSLGATLFALVTGTVPPEAATIPDVGLPALPAELSNAMSKAITTAMTYSIKGRPQSIDEFMQLLNGNNAGGVVPPKKPATPVAPKPTQKSAAPKKRSKWWLWLLLLAIVGGGVFAYLNSQPKDNPEPTDKPKTIVPDTIEEVDSVEVVAPIEEPEPTPAPDPVLRLTSDSRVTVEHGGGNGTIRYSLENPVSGVNLSVSDDANWLTTSRSGNIINYSASANESQSSRTATITVSYGGQSFEVAITQNGKPAPDPVLRLTSDNTITLSHSGSNGIISYTLENPASGVNLSVSDDASWLTTSRSGNTINYSASANESQSSRTATIMVSYGGQNFEVSITQSGKPAGIYAVGDYYNVNGVEGVVFEISDGGRHGKIVSVDQAELGWGPYVVDAPADSETNGKANTDAIMRSSDSYRYAAFTWCSSKGPNWYLPAKSELLTIYGNRNAINATLRARGYTEICNESYWSSTEDNGSFAWHVYMSSGDAYSLIKSGRDYVRAVSAF